MPTDPYTPAELEAGTQALAAHFHRPMLSWCRESTGVVLDAVTLRIERRAQVPLLSLIEDLVYDEPCWYDHGDCCQAHDLNRRPCPHERAKRVLARAHATTEGDHHAD